MKEIDEEIHSLINQLNEWNHQINVLVERQQAVIVNTTQITQDLEALHTKIHTTTKNLKEFQEQKLHQSGMYAMENIGYGG